jgi:hypothetical protein
MMGFDLVEKIHGILCNLFGTWLLYTVDTALVMMKKY